MNAKPRFRMIEVRPHPVETQRESPVEAARRRYGKPFCSEPWSVGEGPRVFTAERVAQIAQENERLRRVRRG